MGNELTHPKHSLKVQSLLDKGFKCYVEGDLEVAVLFYISALVEEPRDPAIHYDLGSVYMNLREYNNALEHLNKAVELDALHSVSPLTQRFNLQYYYFRNYAAAADCERIGDIYFGQRRYDEAIYYFEKAWQINEGNIRCITKTARVYMAKGKYELAAEHFERAIERGDRSLQTFVDLTQIYMRRQMYSKALETIDNAHLLYLDESPVLTNRLRAMEVTCCMRERGRELRRGNVIAAREFFHRARRIMPDIRQNNASPTR